MSSQAAVAADVCQLQGQISSKIKPAKSQKKTRKSSDHGKTVMWINAEIISRSQDGSTVDGLARTISEHLHNMNLVNLTTAIHRLGKIVAYDAKAQGRLKQLPILPTLLTSIANVLSTIQTKHVQPQSLSNILWALATIRIVDVHVIYYVCNHALPTIDHFKSFEMSTLLWALAKLCTLECASPFDMGLLNEIFDSAGKYVVRHVRSIDCRCLSMVVWAYATAKQKNEELFSEVASQIAHGPTPTCQEMANTIWAYGTQNIMNRDLFKSLAKKAIKKLDEFKAQELSNMVWGFASANFFHEEFFEQASAAALSKDLSTQHLANILWAFTRVRPQHPLTQRTVLGLLPLCCQRLSNFKAQEISSVTLSVAKAFTLPEPEQPCQLPDLVTHFFHTVSKASHHLASFSTQSLINMASALAMMRLFDDPLMSRLGQAVVDRAPLMEAADLLRIFQVFLSAQASSADCARIAGLLVSPLAARLNCLRPRDIKVLTSSCSDFLQGSNCQDVFEQCAQMVDCVSAADSKLEAPSAAESDKLKGSISELSNSSEENTDNSMFSLGTECKLNQRTQYGINFAYTPSSMENVSIDYCPWAVPCQQYFYQCDQDSMKSPMQWAPGIQPANAETFFVTSAKLAPNPVPPASSSLWNVEDGCDTFPTPKSSSLIEKGTHFADRAFAEDSSSLAERLIAKVLLGNRDALACNDSGKRSHVCLGDLEKEEVGSTKVVIKNTFIECQHVQPQGLSAIQFCSEKLHCRR